MGLLASITPATRVVVHPLNPGMATLFAPREFTLIVNPVPVFAVVVVYVTQSGDAGVKVGVVVQL
jgi:hypothetical protein